MYIYNIYIYIYIIYIYIYRNTETSVSVPNAIITSRISYLKIFKYNLVADLSIYRVAVFGTYSNKIFCSNSFLVPCSIPKL